jgi:hypothetical protein
MPFVHSRPSLRPVLRALALAGGALAVSAGVAGAADLAKSAAAGKHHGGQRLVVRGDAAAVDGPCDVKGVCRVELTEGRFRGAPVGTGAYTGAVKLNVGNAFPNGEGGICAPLTGLIVLGAGTPNRLAFAVSGDSCQDGAGPPGSGSFTGLARFTIKRATGSYAGLTGSGLASFSEDAAKHHHTTLIGRLSR